jgi:hypothetical protein
VNANSRIVVGGKGHGVRPDQQNITSIVVPGSPWPHEKKPAHGEVKSQMLPSWCGHNVDWKDPVGIPPVEKGDGGRDIDGNVAAVNKDVNDRDAENVSRVLGFASYWARKVYVQQALQTSSCHVTIPFDIDWGCNHTDNPKPVGCVYRIAAANYKVNSVDPVLFEGYLAAVNHDIAIGPQQGRASTHLTFTHVKGLLWDKSGYDPKYGCDPWVAGL